MGVVCLGVKCVTFEQLLTCGERDSTKYAIIGLEIGIHISRAPCVRGYECSQLRCVLVVVEAMQLNRQHTGTEARQQFGR